MATDKPGLYEFLDNLGTTADEVADSISDLDFVGVPGAQYREHVMHIVLKYCANAWSMKITSKGGFHIGDCQIMEPTTPGHIRDFNVAFNEGRYPGLIDWRHPIVEKMVEAGTLKMPRTELLRGNL